MRKLASVILCLCLALIPMNVTALESSLTETTVIDSAISPESDSYIGTDLAEIPEEQNDIQTGISVEENNGIIEVPIDDGGITITPTPSSPEEQSIQKIITYKKAMGEEIPDETDAAAQGIISNGVYCIKNYFSGKYLNVHYGVDSNGTNVYQWTKDGSTEQKFKVVEDTANNCYKIYAMCSSNGNNRVLDVVKNSNPLASGQNVDIWTPVDPPAQNLRLTYLIDGIYHIHMSANQNLYFTTKDSANGTGSGKSSTSAGNVFIQTYNVNDNQQWKFEYLYTADATSSTPTGGIDTVNKNLIKGWAWKSDTPNAPINVNIKVVGQDNTTYLDTIVSANEFHSTSYNLGYGNGYHGFTCHFDFSTLHSATYTIYAYGINANGSYIQLTNSPYTYYYSNAVSAYCPFVRQEKENWCWAACAEMLGKNANPLATRDKYDIVEELKGTDNDPHPDVTGTYWDIINGAVYVSDNNIQFKHHSGYITADEIENLIDQGYAVTIMLGPKAGSDSDVGHDIIIYGYLTCISGNTAGYERRFQICDPVFGIGTEKPYEHILDAEISGRTIWGAVYRKN